MGDIDGCLLCAHEVLHLTWESIHCLMDKITGLQAQPP